MKSYTFIDRFTGAGGLSKGFIRAGYTPIAHIEMNKDSCNTLKTRSGLHYLQKNDLELPVEECPYQVLRDLFSDLPARKAGEGKFCEAVSYISPLSEIPYLDQSGVRGELDFTTQHVARPTNKNDRKIYKIAVER